MAALMEDRPPIGVLDADDIVAHQLEGAPALISVSQLLQSRQVTSFDLLRVPERASGSQLLIGGDVKLGRGVGTKIKTGVDPFAGIHEVLDRSQTRAVNLERVISEEGEPRPGKGFPLRAPIEAVTAMREAKINVVGVANNRADDFGPAALHDSIARLRGAGLSVTGSGNPERHDVFVCSDKRFALLALDDTSGEAADRVRLEEAITKAKAEAESVIILVHWGEEDTEQVTERQRELARRLIDHRADLVVGSHPHCVQTLDFYHGRPIVYSLGNLVFDGAPTVRQWNRGNLLEVAFSERGTSPSLRLIPVKLDSNGLPHAEEPAAMPQR